MFDGNCKKTLISIIYFTFWPSKTALVWSDYISLEFLKQKGVNYAREGRLLFQLEDVQFSFLLEILIDIWLICLDIVKIIDLEIIFILQGFLIFALHCMRNTQVRKNIELIINFISSSFSVSINIRVLRTIFRVARLSADQRAIQKKD